MIAINWKAILLFDSVQFDENAAKYQTVMNYETSKKKLKKNIQTNNKLKIPFPHIQYPFHNVLLSYW